jgi:uncharacterized protein involved in exopolysaccharide biosynthesis
MATQNNTTLHTEDWKRELCEIFFGRSNIIWRTTLVIFAASVAIALFWPRTYAASGSVLLRSKEPVGRSASALEKTDIRTFPVSTEDLTSEQEILMSGELLRRAVESLQGKPLGKGGEPDQETAAEMRRVRAGLKAEIVLSSTVIKLTLRDRDPARAEKTLNAMLKQYLPYRFTVFHPENQEPFLTDRAETYRKKLEDLEAKLIANAKIGSEAALQREVEGNIDLKKLLTQQLSVLRDEYVGSMFLKNEQLEARMKILDMQIKEIEEKNTGLHAKAIEIRQLTREAELLQYSYETFSRRAEEARLNSATAGPTLSEEVSILSGAASSAECVFPLLIPTLVLGLIVGFIAGCSLGFVVEFLDHTFKKPTDVTRYAGLPVVCSIRSL